MKSKKVDWVCAKCGKKYGKYSVGLSTWHNGICDICGKGKIVTQGRDFKIYEK